MPEQEKLLNLQRIDSALAQSTRELERLANVYRQHGFAKESQEILGTVDRIRNHIGSSEPQRSSSREASK